MSTLTHTLTFEPPFTTALLVRLTPDLHELVRQGAEVEDCSLAEFMRDAAIFRLGTLGLVPVVGDDQADEDET